MANQTYEGPWEEISAHASEFSGKKIQVIVLEDESMSDIARRSRKIAAERGVTDEILQDILKDL